jgi:hypothetical protein
MLNYGFTIENEMEKNIILSFEPQLTKQIDSKRKAWNKYLQRHPTPGSFFSPALKSLCRMGIPPEYRGMVWYHVSGAKRSHDHNPNLYEHLLTQTINPKHIDWINKDIPRTFPAHPFFASFHNREKLREVLVQYAKYRPEVGYRGGMNFVAAILVIHLIPRHAFHVLDIIMTKLNHLEPPGLAIEMSIVDKLIEKRCSRLYTHLRSYLGENIMQLFAVKWLICIFIDQFPMETTLRVWDAFMMEGDKVLLRVIISFMQLNEETLLHLHGFEPIINAINASARLTLDSDELMSKAFAIKRLSRSSIRKLRDEHK